MVFHAQGCKSCNTYGSLAKASSVGAKTVNGPAPFSAGTRPAAVRAAARVLKEPAETAVSTISAMLTVTLEERTGARVDTKALAATREDTRRIVCIIVKMLVLSCISVCELDMMVAIVASNSKMNVPKSPPFISSSSLFLVLFSSVFLGIRTCQMTSEK